MYIKKVVCLANSEKHGSGRCIAGKEVFDQGFGNWIRPVSSREGREVSEEERRYENGRKAKLLDIIEIPLLEPAPLAFQVENHVLGDRYYWEKERTASWSEILSAKDGFDENFWSEFDSTYYGENDKIPEDDAGSICSSLKLIFLPVVKILVRTEPGYQGRPSRRRVRVQFDYHGEDYILSVTDPEIKERYLGLPDNECELRDVLICVSLAEAWHGYAYRVAAAVITRERC